MSITAPVFLSILRIQNASQSTTTRDYEYEAVLGDVRAKIAEHHAKELAAVLQSEDAAVTLRGLITRYAAERMAGREYDSDALVERIFEDMAGLGVLTQYLRDPDVEEINGNSYKLIEIITRDQVRYLYKSDAFSSPVAAVDIVKRMVRMGGKLLDEQTPKVDSYVGDGVRISASIPPLVPEDKGVVFSIRKQRKGGVGREQIIQSGAATPEILDFLTMCLCHKVSVGLAGGVGSGKTTMQTLLLNEYIRKNEDHNNRINVIEDSREIELLEYDIDHDRPARVMYNMTSEAWSMMRLVADSLRYDPALIVPAEVRDGAALAAASAGQTGHTILTSFHASSARDGYKRLRLLCNNANSGLPNETLLEMCVDAWPIMVYLEQQKDNVRRTMEVFEATGIAGGRVQGNLLWKFDIEKTERDEDGKVVNVRGTYRRVGCISPRLYSFLRDRGVPEPELLRLFPDARPEEEVMPS